MCTTDGIIQQWYLSNQVLYKDLQIIYIKEGSQKSARNTKQTVDTFKQPCWVPNTHA